MSVTAVVVVLFSVEPGRGNARTGGLKRRIAAIVQPRRS